MISKKAVEKAAQDIGILNVTEAEFHDIQGKVISAMYEKKPNTPDEHYKELENCLINIVKQYDFKSGKGGILKGVEIFAVGRWNGLSFTKKDLQDIATNYSALLNEVKIPLKLGHNKEQKITDGVPALGWVTNVYVEGDKLKADFENVPSIMMNAINENLYRSVSIELLKGATFNKKRYSWVLRAVAILGATPPAVNVLDDLKNFLPKDTQFSENAVLCFSLDEKEAAMSVSQEEFDQLKKRLDTIEDENRNLKDENYKFSKESKEAKEKAEKLESEKQAEKVSFARKQVTEKFEKAVKDKKIAPSHRELFSKMLGVDDDEKVLTIQEKDVDDLIASVNFSSSTESSMSENDDQSSDELDTKVMEFMAKANDPNLSYESALQVVMAQNKQLAREHVDANGEYSVR